MSNSTRPSKPREDFPLFPHRTGRWCKKVRGAFCYFGKVADDPKGEKALAKWLDQKDDLLAGRVPRPKTDALTVGELCNLWLDWKQKRVNSGELAHRTWEQYKSFCQAIIAEFGRERAAIDLGPDDWQRLRDVYAKRWGPGRLGVAVIITKHIWNWGWSNRKLSAPPQFGSGFTKPSAKTVRQKRQESGKGPRMLTPEEIHRLLAVAGPNMKAMLLLGVQSGIGNTDLALMELRHLDLESGWLELPRAKTAIMRRIPLWTETVDALREAIARRPKPTPGNESKVFVNSRGGNYIADKRGTLVWKEFQRCCQAAGVEGRTYYDTRRTFATVADGAKDPVAVTHLMGHAPKSGDMASVYRQKLDDSRLLAAVQVVYDWLFGQDHDDRQDHDDDRQQAPKEAPKDTRAAAVTRAVMRCLKAIADAAEPNKSVLRGVWNESEIGLALAGDWYSSNRFLETWGDATEGQSRFRVVG